jgi:hypothetical protein
MTRLLTIAVLAIASAASSAHAGGHNSDTRAVISLASHAPDPKPTVDEFHPPVFVPESARERQDRRDSSPKLDTSRPVPDQSLERSESI